MIITSTDQLQGYEIVEYLGIVSGETISGANVVRDVMATVTDFIGGRSGTYEEIISRSRETTLDEIEDRARLLGADAIVGLSMDYETVGSNGSMLLVSAHGTAVKLRSIR